MRFMETMKLKTLQVEKDSREEMREHLVWGMDTITLRIKTTVDDDQSTQKYLIIEFS